MKPKNTPLPQDDLFKNRLETMIDIKHKLVKLSELIDWQSFDNDWGKLFPSNQGAPAIPTRMIAGLHYLKHLYDLSDEQVVERWVENPYWQYFCGEVFLSGQKRGVTNSIKKALKRRSAIEPEIGHMKNDGRLNRNYLKGDMGDMLNVILCASGHNLRKILNKLAQDAKDFLDQILKAWFLDVKSI